MGKIVSYFILSLLLAFTTGSSGSDSSVSSNISNCLADAIVLEGILIEASAYMATGFLIKEAISKLKYFVSLLPQWSSDCKGTVSELNIPTGSLEDIDIKYTAEGIEINGQLYLPNKLLEDYKFSDCISALEQAASQVLEFQENIENSQNQAAANFLYSLSNLTEQVKRVCKI